MNYVFFFLDELRAESIGCYGNEIVKTPNYDRLASEGTTFLKNYTAHPVCIASRCAIATGWYPHVGGHRSLRYMIDANTPNLIRYIKDAGFKCGHFGKNHMFEPDVLAETYDVTKNPPNMHGNRPFKGTGEFTMSPTSLKAQPKADGSPDYSMVFPPVADDDEKYLGDATAVRYGIEFIKECSENKKPFFLFLPLDNPHPPYAVPETYYNMYDPENITEMRSAEWLKDKPEFYNLVRKYRNMENADETELRKIQAIYYGMISYTDALLGRIISALEENSIYDDTTIIICADHGDWAGDVGLIEKWPSGMDDMLTRVPLIIRRPGGAEGHIVETPTSSIDILPTICDLENITIHHDHFGVSLAPQLYGKPGDSSRTVYCEGGYDMFERHVHELLRPTPMHIPGAIYYPKSLQQDKHPESVCRTVMMRNNRYKFVVRTNGENELYDMDNDPLEYENLYCIDEYKELVVELKDKMLTWMISTSDVVPHDKGPSSSVVYPDLFKDKSMI
ncbi:MAG: sulfatase-like hydrolase/transferase [Eubacteriales bacterium]